VLASRPPAECDEATLALQAHIDDAIVVRHAGREFPNVFDAIDGTPLRQIIVTADGSLRCAVCTDLAPWDSHERRLDSQKTHCGCYNRQSGHSGHTLAHLDRLLALTAAASAVVSLPAAASTAAVAESDSENDEPVVESDGEGDLDWVDQGPAKKPRGAPPKKVVKGPGPTTSKGFGGTEAVRAWRSTLTPDAWDALASAAGLTCNNVPARGWNRELKMRKASATSKCDISFHPPGQLVSSEILRSMPEVSRYLAANVTPLFEAPHLDDFSLARGGNLALFSSPLGGYYKRLRSRVTELLRPAAAPALPPSASARPPAAPALPPPQPQNARPPPKPLAKPRAAPVPAAENTRAARGGHPNAMACEVRRVGGSWRRYACQKDASDKFPGLTQAQISALVNESRDGRLRIGLSSAIRDIYEARDYVGDDFETEDEQQQETPAAPAPAPTPTACRRRPLRLRRPRRNRASRRGPRRRRRRSPPRPVRRLRPAARPAALRAWAGSN